MRKKQSDIDFEGLDKKHKEETLKKEIKNLDAEMRHLKEENEYCREAATEASLKIANIC